MAEILVEIAKPMVEVMVNRVMEEIHLFRGFKNELNKLQHKVNMTESIVKCMTEVSAGAEVEGWLRNVINIIYKAENVFDVLAYEKHRSVVMKRRSTSTKAFKGKMKLIFAPLERLLFRCKIGRQIRSIIGGFEDSLKEANDIVQLQKLVRSSASVSALVHPASTKMMSNDEILQQVRQHVDMSVFIGRESDVNSVVDKLCNPSRQDSQNLFSNHSLHVVAIVGMGGLGKTSLAKKVYMDGRVTSHFSERIWISELKDFNTDKVLNTMLEYVGKGDHQNGSADIAIRKLGEYLGGKRYLLVLDDVWSTNRLHWDSLRYQLETIVGSSESMVLATTRDDAVAEAMHASSVHHLQGLLDNESWSLFQKIALANRSDSDVSALESTGRNIVEKCKGVPLAIKSIAGLLQSNKRDPHEWRNVEISDQWNAPNDKTGMLPSLKLSYDHLSSPLKKCFSLCASWPRSFRFKKYVLILKWIALGLVRNSSNENLTLEEIGEEYFNELLSISFISIESRNDLGEAYYYNLHDLIYDLARSVATNERLYLEANKEVNNGLGIQHISILGSIEIPMTNFPDKLVLENIRSLETWHNSPIGLLMHLKYLRVLTLLNSNVEELPEMISELKCLKLLDLTNNPIKVFPECIIELYSLQSLSLYNCQQLVKIPEDRLGSLVNLRHIFLSINFCPPKGILGQLSQLQTLPPLLLSEGGFQISELGSLLHLRGDLEIKGLEVVKSKVDAAKADLSKKARVEQLQLRWDNDCLNSKEVLDGLCPHPNLKLLSIKGYAGEKFPSWLMKMNVSGEHNNVYAGRFSNLIKFELSNCGRCQQLPTLGHLSSLKKIVITNMEKVLQIGPEFYSCVADSVRCNENQESSSRLRSTVKSFPSLKELHLRHLSHLTVWCEPGPGVRTAFPALEELVIERCVELQRMPNDFPSLRELTMKKMSNSRPLLNLMTNRTSLKCLKKLEIERVKELTHIPKELGECISLQTLCIIRCYKLTSLPEKMSKLVSLEVLTIKRCNNLVSLPNLSGLVSLREFTLFENDALRGIPEGLKNCKSLEKLIISRCAKVETLPDLAALSRLSNLSIIGMTKMIMQPPDWLLCSLSCLRYLHIGDYEKLYVFPDLRPLLRITSIEQLSVYGWEKLHSVPKQLQQFTNLTCLGIADFENVEQLPDWLGNLSSLQGLLPSRCKRLKKLPSEEAMKRLTSLRFLVIEDCPLLEEATNINGPEHHKIVATSIEVIIENSTNN